MRLGTTPFDNEVDEAMLCPVDVAHHRRTTLGVLDHQYVSLDVYSKPVSGRQIVRAASFNSAADHGVLAVKGETGPGESRDAVIFRSGRE